MDAYESDRAESGRKEIVKGMKYTLQKYQTAHDREIIDDMLMTLPDTPWKRWWRNPLAMITASMMNLKIVIDHYKKEGKSRKRLFFLGKKIPLITIRSVFSL